MKEYTEIKPTEVGVWLSRLLKSVKFQIELLWSVLGGLGFTVLVRLFESGSADVWFKLGRNIFTGHKWMSCSYGECSFGTNLDNFLFGFIITAIIIWSVKVYRRN
jgi:hypothetical protein